MSYVKRHLIPGEELIYETRLHWVVMLGHLLLACLLGAGGIALLYYAFTQGDAGGSLLPAMRYAGWGLLVLALIVVIMGMVRRNATEMAVTNRRVVIKVGLMARKTIEMLLGKVETVEVTEPLMGRMLGYGSILIIGTGGTSEPFHKLARPEEFRSRVQQQIEKLQPASDRTR